MRIACAVFALILSSAVAKGNDLETKLVKEYDRQERSQSLLAHHGSILAGRTGYVEENGSFVEQFDPVTLEMTGSFKLSHSIRNLQSMDQCRVLAYGTEQYSVINYCAQPEPTAKTRSIGPEIVAHTGTYVGSERFVFTEPNAGILEIGGGRATRNLGENIPYTIGIEYLAGSLWIANYGNLWRVELSGNRRTPLFDNNLYYGIKNISSLKTAAGAEVIGATTRDGGSLLLVDAVTNKLRQVVEIGGEPEGLVPYGKCFIVTTAAKRAILFVKVGEEQAEIIDAWDANGAGDRLKLPQLIAIDPATQKVFLRSSYPCPTCAQTQSSIFAFSSAESAVLRNCME